MKNRLLLCTAIVFFLANSLSAQQNVGDLLTQRQTIISNGGSTSSIDQQLYQLGHVPTAIVTLIGTNQIEFPFFQPIPDEKVTRIQQRLMATYSYVSAIEVIQTSSIIRITYTQAPSPTMITELVTHFSYNGHEIH